uniref:probable inactive dual specificity protein phosphatase-like At4g18593 isoform X2 n=1 Tax=Erigeron canadensis TaxID=72917 RepID=UPI001CB9C584|nr:probable inactive dual specificity protein phosphatase-like At4g18593 isoform X2 [Erigeron canadensis]
MMSNQVESPMEVSNHTENELEKKPQKIYRCKKCRRMVATEDHLVPHEHGEGKKCFRWRKKAGDVSNEDEPPECLSIFVQPMKWMQAVEEGAVEEKLQCIGCNTRLGSFNWAGMQCNCGVWVNPAFRLHKSRIDECRF